MLKVKMKPLGSGACTRKSLFHFCHKEAYIFIGLGCPILHTVMWASVGNKFDMLNGTYLKLGSDFLPVNYWPKQKNIYCQINHQILEKSAKLACSTRV